MKAQTIIGFAYKHIDRLLLLHAEVWNNSSTVFKSNLSMYMAIAILWNLYTTILQREILYLWTQYLSVSSRLKHMMSL